MVKEVGTHEVGVALVVVLGQSHVLVQVHGVDLGEVQVAGLVLGDQLLIGAHGAAAGSQAQHTVGLQLDLSGNDVGGLAAHVCVIFGANQSHNNPLLYKFFIGSSSGMYYTTFPDGCTALIQLYLYHFRFNWPYF